MATNEISPTPAVRTRPIERSRLDDGAQKRIFAGGSVLGAIAMSSCRILPLALFSVGVTSAWIGSLSALYAYKLYFFAVAAAFLGAGFHKVYRKPAAAECADGTYCASPTSDRIIKVVLWSSTILVMAALVFPYTAPLFLDM